MKLSTPLLQNWLKRFSPTAFFVESVKVQKAPAQRRGPGCLTKVSYMNLQQEAGSAADGGQGSSSGQQRAEQRGASAELLGLRRSCGAACCWHGPGQSAAVVRGSVLGW